MSNFEKNLAVLEKSYEKNRLFEINQQEGTWECNGIYTKGERFLMRRSDFSKEVQYLHKLRLMMCKENDNMDAFWRIKKLSENIILWTERPNYYAKDLIMDFSFLKENTLRLVYDFRDIDEPKNETN